MDFLQDMFPGHDPHMLHRAFEQAGGDVVVAIELIFSELDDLQSMALRQAEQDHHPVIGPEGPIQNPPSPANPLQALTISDADDSDDFEGPAPQRQQSGYEAATPDDQLRRENDNIPSPDEFLASVLAIFPDACTEHLKKEYNENRCSDIIELIVTKLAEVGYPRAAPEQKAGHKRKRPLPEEEEGDESGKEYEDEHRAVSDKYSGFV